MRTDPRLWLLAVALAMVGCGRAVGDFEERSGREAMQSLPDPIADLVPEDAVLCLDDARSDGGYRIWILRRPDGDWLNLPTTFGRGKSAVKSDTHDMPATALLGVLRSRLPSLDPGAAASAGRCRFTHWRLPDGAEVQLREIVSDRGWFASVERVAM